MKFNTAEEAIDYLHKVTKQQEIRDETNKLMDGCYTKGSHGLMVFQRQKFLNELFPLLDRLGVVVKVDRELPNYQMSVPRAGYVAVEPLISVGCHDPPTDKRDDPPFFCGDVLNGVIMPWETCSKHAMYTVEPLIFCSSCKKEPCKCPSINRGSFAKYVEEG